MIAMADQDLHRPTDAPTSPASPDGTPPQTGPAQTSPPQAAAPPPEVVPAHAPLPRTRFGGAWVALAAGALVLLLLLIFILENSQIIDLPGRLEDSLVGRNVEIGRSPIKPRAYKMLLGDNSKVGVL